MSSNVTQQNYRSLAPLSGYHLDVYIQSMDTDTSYQTLLGRFTSFQLTIRNETIPYAELNTRTIRHLDGMVAIGWTLERGLISIDDVTKRLFGTDYIGHELRLDEFPRFAITVEFNAPSLSAYPADKNQLSDIGEITINGADPLKSQDGSLRMTKGRYRLLWCKPDTVTLAGMAGGNPVANRIEGLAESIALEELTGTDYVDPGYLPTFEGKSYIKTDLTDDLGTGTSIRFPSWITETTTR